MNCADCLLQFEPHSHDKHKHCDNIKRIKNLYDLDMKHFLGYTDDCTKSGKGTLFAIHQNARSLNKNINSLRETVRRLNDGGNPPSICGITETWINKNSDVSNLKRIQIPGYHFLNSGRDKGRGGGAGIYIAEHLQFTQRTDIQIQCSESIWIDLNTRIGTVVIGVVYSSGKQQQDAFLQSLDETLETLAQRGKKVILLGDLNINLLACSSTHPYCRALLGNGFQSMVAFPTRPNPGGTATLLDQIITNVVEFPEQPTGGVLINDLIIIQLLWRVHIS